MWVTLHTILLLAMPLATVGGLLLLPRRQLTAGNLTMPLLVSLMAMSLAFTFSTHLCGAGLPWRQVLLGGACLVPWATLVKSRGLRRGGTVALFIATLGLSQHFSEVVHRPGWSGNSDWPRYGAIARDFARSVHAMADHIPAPEATQAYPPGWLRDLPIAAKLCELAEGAGLSELPERYRLRRCEFGRAWHTWLTGLYPYELVPQDLWYPGGSLGEGLRRVELRNRSD